MKPQARISTKTMVGVWRFSLAFTLIAYHILVSCAVPDSTLYPQILSLRCMEKLLFLLSYVILFPLLRAVRAGFRGVPEPLAWKNQHDEERARERKVDMSAQ